MARIISSEGPGKQRTILTRGIVAGIRKLVLKNQYDDESRDIVSFIILSLEMINDSVEKSVAAWEKRNYWIKADKFRQDWSWAAKESEKLRVAYLENNLGNISAVVANIGKNLGNVKIPERNRIGTPWKGFQDRFK